MGCEIVACGLALLAGAAPNRSLVLQYERRWFKYAQRLDYGEWFDSSDQWQECSNSDW